MRGPEWYVWLKERSQNSHATVRLSNSCKKDTTVWPKVETQNIEWPNVEKTEHRKWAKVEKDWSNIV
jgi:hypothetical protein